MVKNAGIKFIVTSFFVLLPAFHLMASMAEAIPLFARNYKISCTTCHIGFPKLNSFGEAFAGNGYRFAENDLAEQNVETGDEKLQLLNHLPLAIRADSFFRVRNDTETNTDFEGPFTIKILSSAPLTEKISYYFYFLFDERGDTGGVEDAFIHLNDAYKDVDLDLRFGQFQVTDVLFPREQRLTFQDFTYYVTAISDSGFRLTYDRVVEMTYNFDVTENLGMGLVAGVANGNGIGVADSDRNFDSDNFKNFYGKVDFSLGEQNIGVYAYSGRGKNSAKIRNEFFRVGPVFSFWLFEDWNLWGNFLYGEDSNPKFRTGPVDDTRSWGGFAGVTKKFKEDWLLSLLYNRVKVYGRQELDANTVTANLTYYLMRNLNLLAEVTADIEDTNRFHPEKEHTGVLGIVLAY
ncbi:MAG: hypothetical protein NPINA01_11100 [Nitrospinaceae bacterium]|nr:MAG: hypothetical protein NPINA01_11100 [Nitrospinaceae bacterium]